jgi:adenine-specific DNA-methyltransferase
MNKLSGRTMDLVQNNIYNLKQLFPEVVTEGKIDFEKLLLILGENIETNKEKYEFTWNGKSNAIKIAQTPSTGTLLPDKESSKNWDKTENLYIEGDNLEVLKLLQKSYFSKIKMIYIDPPYNTGKDFVYRDNFRDSIKNYKEQTEQTTKANVETSGRYHTDWLNMMYPRLKLARNLLEDSGVIFISIDDKEMANLRKIMNEIFGEENLLAELVWDLGTGTQAGHFTRSHEYLLVYVKNKESLPNFSGGEGYIDDRATKKISAKNPASTFEFPAGVRFDAPNGTEFYGEWGGSEKIKLLKGRMIAQNGKLVEPITLEAGWSMKKQMESWFNGEETLDTKGQKVIEFYFNLNGVLRYKKERSVINPATVLRDKGSTRLGTQTVENLLKLNNPFDFPKPVSLIKYISSLVLGEEDIILDFFSGSATTAHSIMELNAEDGGNRRYIMIQLPELIEVNSDSYKAGYKNICEIARERIRLAGQNINHDINDERIDTGFKVFRLEESNIKQWTNGESIVDLLSSLENNIVEGRTNVDLLYEILLKIGLPLTAPIETINLNNNTIYDVAFGSVLLCLDDDITLEVVNEMLDHLSEDIETKVIFKEIGFRDDTTKTNAIQTLKKYGVKEENIRSV